MESLLPSTERRTAATWVAATGAFLLIAAAGVFVSVRWDDIPDAAKLGVLLAGTGAALVGGRTLARTLPGTGGVLFHLGAFLLPVDLAAISLRTEMTWGELLLAEGLLTGIGLGALALWSDSVVLRWASTAGVVGLAGGIGAVSGVPAALALVGFAVVAALVGDPRTDTASTWWAAIAGLSPTLLGLFRGAFDGSELSIGVGTVADLGFDDRSLARSAWVVGFVAAAILARAAQRRADVGLAFLSIIVPVVGVVTSFASGDVGGDLAVVSISGGFLAVELVALSLRRDPFWSEPLHLVAVVLEVLSVPVVAALTLGGWMYELGGYEEPFVSYAIAIALAAAAWFAADLRRQPESSLSLPMRLLRGGGSAVANIGFAACAFAAVTVADPHDGPQLVLAATAIATFLVAAGRPTGHVAIAVVTLVVAGNTLHQPELLVPAVVSCAWASTLRRNPVLAAVAAIGLDVVLLRVLADLDVRGPDAGLALCVTAVVWAGLAGVVDGDEWRNHLAVPAVVALAIGVALAGEDPVALADAIVITGGLVLAGGLVSRNDAVAHVGGVLVSGGVVGHLAAAGVDVAEPYVLPVGAHLLVAGWHRRRQVFTSSWLAYVPSVALVGGTALAERIAGGAEWHALVAAAVGTLAVAIGGWQRLAGPLLTGTALLIATTAHESLGALAGIPTWTWLAVAGTVLLGTGIALERTDTSPVVAGRRLVDVIGERFE